MFPTARCFAAKPPGFVKRSAEELSRISKIAWNMETLDTPTKPYNILNFEDESTVAGCKTMADRAVGGYSSASLDYVPAVAGSREPAHARFHGSISTKLPADWRVQRTGYAAFRNQDRGLWLFGRLFWDVDPYAYLALRVKSDGRRYTINIQTDSIVETDIHQHRLYTKHHRLAEAFRPSSPAARETRETREVEEDENKVEEDENKVEEDENKVEEELEDDEVRMPRRSPQPTPAALADVPPPAAITRSATTPTLENPDATGWETVLVRWTDFVRTSHGMVVEPQTSLLKQKIKSIGIGLTDRVQGPYDLRIHRIWATNGITPEEAEEERRICGPDALGVGEGTSQGWYEDTVVERDEKTKNKGFEKLKGLRGLKDEWEK